MRPTYISEKFLEHFIAEAFREDVGEGDHSTLACIPSGKTCRANLLVKDDGILAGVALAEQMFHFYDPSLKLEVHITDGTPIKRGDVVFTVFGAARSILSTERLVLNCMQRMSGIATKTHQMVAQLEGTPTRLMDTRKTTPNFRLLEKWAVYIGGGVNHRLGLYDMIMLKDNHIDVAGGIEQAINQTKEYLRANKLKLMIEVETRSLAEVEEVLRVGGVDVVMLDNMSLQEMKQCVEQVGGRFRTEASGGITEETLAHVAACGVDFISVGALTHAVKSLDLSLKVSMS